MLLKGQEVLGGTGSPPPMPLWKGSQLRAGAGGSGVNSPVDMTSLKVSISKPSPEDSRRTSKAPELWAGLRAPTRWDMTVRYDGCSIHW